MLKKIMFAFLMSLFFMIPFGNYASGSMKESSGLALNRSYSLRLPFVENRGQVENGKAVYYAKTSWGTVFVTEDGEMVYSITRENGERGWAVRESFVGATVEDVRAYDKVETKINYFRGSKPENWRRDVPAYNSVSLGEIYEGIKLRLKAYDKSVEKLFHLEPYAAPDIINLRIDGAEGLSVNEEGGLEINTGLGLVKLTKPVAYQEEGGEKKYVEVAYAVRGNEYGFRLGHYDRAKELVIDPLLASTFLGGSGDDSGGITLASDGSVYVGGTTTSSDFPATVGAYDTTSNGGSPNGQGAFVAKLDANLSGPWRIETVDGAYDTGYSTSLALDSSGRAHISYYDGGLTNLKYATNASGQWTIETVDSTQNVGDMSSIAIDSFNKAHISYRDWANYYLKYASNASGTWVIETVDNTGTVFSQTSLALDSSGKAHISYYSIINGDLKYATNASGTWVTETVDSAGDVGQYASLALDSSGKAHISYFDYGNADLKYAVCCPDGWITETVDSIGTVGQYTSLALDSSGKAHISYYDNTNQNIKYATNASGQWVTETVGSTGAMGGYQSLALDSSGKAHISYRYSSTNDSLKYATNASGQWITETVDSAGNVGRYASIALDASDNAYISYFDDTNNHLKYATNAPVPACAFIEGDADGSGMVNVVDVVKARRFSLGLDSLPQDLCAVDIDSSTTVDILDVVNILRIALGLPTA